MKAKYKFVTIKDIAKKAKVSVGTVDRVLHKRGRVAANIEKRVLQIIKETGYEPNILARTLVSQKQYSVAALIPDEIHGIYWHAPKEGINTAYKELKKYGMSVDYYLFNPFDPNSFTKQANAVNQAQPDAIILTPIFHREALSFVKAWEEQNIPFVFFNTKIPDSQPLSFVGQDNYQSGYLAGKLLHYSQSAPCSFVIIHFDQDITNAVHLEKKDKGFKNYFIQNNLSQFEILTLEISDTNDSKFVEKMDNIFESNQKIKGAFVSNAKVFKVAEYLTQKRHNDVKLIGYDIIPENIRHLEKGVISFLINQNPKGQGFWALQMVADELIFNKKVPALKYLPLDIVTKENVSYFMLEEEV